MRIWAARDAWHLRPEPHLKLAELYEAIGQHDAAESQMREALARSDYRLDMQLQMADLLANHKKYDESLELLRAGGANADKAEIHEKIIQVLIAAGRVKEATDQIQADLAQNPPYAARLLAQWAQLLTMNSDWGGAIDKSNQSLALDPGNGIALSCRAWSRLHATPPDPSGALDDLKRLHQAAPDNAQIRLEMVDAYILLDDPQEAATELEVALRSDPMNKAARMRLVQILGGGAHPRLSEALRLLQDVDSTPPFDKDPDIFEAEATVMGDMNNLPDAIQASEKAISLQPYNFILLKTHMDLLLKAENYNDVLTAAANLSQDQSGAWWALLDRGVAENHLNDPTSASADMNKALGLAATSDDSAAINRVVQAMAKEFGPDRAIAALLPYASSHEPTKSTLAMIYHLKGDDAHSAAMLDSVMQGIDKLHLTDQVAAVAMAAQIYQTMQPQPMPDKAYDAYQRWLKLEPDNTTALNNLACLLADSYSPPRATEGLQYIQKAADHMNQTGRTDASILDTEGWLFILSGDPAQGVTLLNQAITAQPLPESYFHIAQGYLLLQYPTEANKEAQLGLSLLDTQSKPGQELALRNKLKGLIARSEELMKSKQQAQVP